MITDPEARQKKRPGRKRIIETPEQHNARKREIYQNMKKKSELNDTLTVENTKLISEIVTLKKEIELLMYKIRALEAEKALAQIKEA